MKHRQRILLALLFLVYFTIVYLVMWQTGISCVFLHFLGIPCPGCGMTRALCALLRLDFVGALKYNPLIFCMPYVFAYIFLDFKNRKVHNIIIKVIGILALVNWICNIFKILV